MIILGFNIACGKNGWSLWETMHCRYIHTYSEWYLVRRSCCSATSNEKFSRGSQMQHYLCFEAPSLQGSLLHYHWTTAHSRSRLSYIHWTPPELSLCGSLTLSPQWDIRLPAWAGLSTTPSHGGAAKGWLHDIRDNVPTVNESPYLLFSVHMYPSHAHSDIEYFPLLGWKLKYKQKQNQTQSLFLLY